MAEEFDVIVNGGGPVGLGLAIELGLRGVRVAVAERRDAPQPIPKGQNLTQRTMEHFHFWGCEERLRAAHPVPPGAGIGGMTCYRTLLSPHRYDWLNRALVRDYYFRPNARLPQYATEAALRARAAEIPAIDLRIGWSGEAVAQDAAGATLTIEERGTGRRRELRGAYLVGCDGSRSLVREAAGIPETREEHEKRMALLVFTSTELHELLRDVPDKAFFCVLHPEHRGYWLFFGRVDHGRSWFFHAPVPADATEENFDFTAYLHRAVGRPFALTLDHVGFWDLRFALADRYREGRVFIAGDAAHSHPPYGGYGVNTGLEDARNLGWKLAATLQGWGGPGLLDSYDAERRPVFASTAKDFIERFIVEDREFLDAYAPEKDAAVFAEKWARRNESAAEVVAFEPHYEGSPIAPGSTGRPGARGEHSFAARAGHHLAPAPLSDGRNVYEALGDGFTLLAFGAQEAAVGGFERTAAALGVPLRVVRDAASGGRERYAAALVLVRPDQFVAWAGAEGDAGEILAAAVGGRPAPRA